VVVSDMKPELGTQT